VVVAGAGFMPGCIVARAVRPCQGYLSPFLGDECHFGQQAAGRIWCAVTGAPKLKSVLMSLHMLRPLAVQRITSSGISCIILNSNKLL
jgi:hypothetical protein